MRSTVPVFILVFRLISINCGVISNANFAFEVFSPKSLIRFFEFNDMGWNISQDCIKNMYTYLDGLQKDLKWTYKLFDASGNYAGGFFYGQNFRPSNPNQCYRLNDELNYLIARDDFDLVNTSSVVPFFVQLVSAKYVTYVDNQKREIQQSSCLPVACSFDDLMQVMSYAPFAQENVLKDTELVEVRILYQTYKFYLDANFTIIVAITSVMLGLIIGISFYACFYRSKMRVKKNENFNRNISSHRVEAQDADMRHCSHKTAEISGLEDVNVSDVKVCRNKTANFKMNEHADSLTITSKNCHHVNLVKLRKNKVDNTITLDIISNCATSKHRARRNEDQFGDMRQGIFKFSFQNQLSNSTPFDTPHDIVDESNAIHGIRALSLFWIILLNVTTIISYSANNLKYVEEKDSNWIIQIIFKNGSFSIDSYFFVNGILLCQIFFNTSRELKISNVSGISKHFQHFFGLVSYKILRILLPYLIIIHSTRVAMKHFNENSILSVPSNDHFTCDNIWKNIFFLDNFYPYESRCVLWSWWISLELQFFVIGLLVLMVSRNSRRFALVIFLAFFTSSFFATTAMGVQSSKITQIASFTSEERLIHFNGIYDRPLSHLGPYLIGIFFGFFSFNSDKKLKVNPMLIAIGWIVSFVLCILLMMSAYSMDGVDPWIKQSFATISHTFWSLVLLWICFATSSGYGGILNDIFSSHFLQVISKISNSVMLIHPLITRVFILGSNNAIFVSVPIIIIAFFGFAVISLLLGLLFHAVYEGPVLVMLHAIYDKLVKKSKSNIPC